MKCKNCSAEFDSPYCPQCGQESSTSPLSYRSLAQSVMLSFGTIDRGVLRTVIDLFVRPAHMAIEYVFGKRVTFFAPFQLLFILATVYMIIYFWSGESSDFTMPKGSEEFVSPGFEMFFTKSIRFFQNNRGIMWALCIPIQVFVFRLLYKKIRYRFTWVETCFIAAYFFSQIIIVELIAFFFSLTFSSVDFVNSGKLMLIYLLLLSYDLKQLTGGTWKKNIFKCLFSQVLFFLTLGILAIIAIVIAFSLGLLNFDKAVDLLT